MKETLSTINSLIVDVFNDILTIEENALKKGSFSDVSITEVHTIEAIGMYTKKTATEVAKKLKITAGTLTVAINNLVKKGYVSRDRSEDDRRVVQLGLTNKGRVLYRVHDQFHKDLVREAAMDLDEDEESILVSALIKLHKFLYDKYMIEV